VGEAVEAVEVAAVVVAEVVVAAAAAVEAVVANKPGIIKAHNLG